MNILTVFGEVCVCFTLWLWGPNNLNIFSNNKFFYDLKTNKQNLIAGVHSRHWVENIMVHVSNNFSAIIDYLLNFQHKLKCAILTWTGGRWKRWNKRLHAHGFLVLYISPIADKMSVGCKRRWGLSASIFLIHSPFSFLSLSLLVLLS